jgi:hypothetical protein
MGAVGVDVDSVPVFSMAIAAKVGSLIDNQAAQTRIACQPGEGCTVQTAANDQIVVSGHGTGIKRITQWNWSIP